jgi:hypothetical protein
MFNAAASEDSEFELACKVADCQKRTLVVETPSLKTAGDKSP